MNWKKIFLSGIIIWVVGIVWTFLTCGWLFNWVYKIEPIIWKPAESITTAGNFLGANLIGLVAALIFAAVFALLYKGIPGRGVQKGLYYGLIIWLVGALSGMATMPFYMTISTAVVIYWILNALVANLIFGAIVGAIYKAK